MKNIQEIMMEIDNITNKQVAVDLSEGEKEELTNLISTDSASTLKDFNALLDPPDPCCTAAPAPCDCSPGTFCCVVTVPPTFSVIGGANTPSQLHAGVEPKSPFSIVPGSSSLCNVTVGGCTLPLNRARVNGCAKVYVSLGVQDSSGNCTFICCNDCVCFIDTTILCCNPIPSSGTIVPKFAVSNLRLSFVAQTGVCTGINGNDSTIYQITGQVVPTC